MYEPDLDPFRYDPTTEGSCDDEGYTQCEAVMEQRKHGDYVKFEAFDELKDAYEELKEFYDKVKEALP